MTIGGSCLGKPRVFVHRDEDENIRIIRARKATRRERKHYKEGM